MTGECHDSFSKAAKAMPTWTEPSKGRLTESLGGDDVRGTPVKSGFTW
jgi:hypothetical protein